MSEFPAKGRDLVGSLVDGGWSFMVRHGVDTGDSPFVSVEAVRDRRKLMVTWHTRATGTYRLFSCMGRGDSGGMHDMSLSRAVALIDDPMPL